jgi:hypothetical protein
MAQEMQDLDLLKAQEDVKTSRQRVGLDLGEAQGQQMMAADARAAAAAATASRSTRFSRYGNNIISRV